MKKIGLVTIVDYKNYGNRLQNYATQQVLKSIGYNVTTIINKSINKTNERVNKGLIDRLKGKTILELVKILNYHINKKKYQEALYKKVEVFKNFSNENINESDFIVTVESGTEQIGDDYDFFIAGSDQIWNPMYRYGSSIDFLTFAPKYKRIAYAPSFGISSIPEEYRVRYKRWLSEMHRLSVREETGVKIIKKLTGRDVIVLVDPTLMLSKDKWLSISKEDIHKPDNPYLLTYFLGQITKETRKKIKKIAREKNLEIVRLADIRDKKRYEVGPSEFIDYISSAALVCTDSFHGSVFSILLETPFIVFDRVGVSMYSRIETLLTRFQLKSRKAENIKTNERIFDIDYSHIPLILEKERKKAYDYLKEALNVE